MVEGCAGRCRGVGVRQVGEEGHSPSVLGLGGWGDIR